MASKATSNKDIRGQRGGRPSKRDFILEQAEYLVLEEGAAQLTFDALTQRTGISKGGLLYHFDSKEALIMAMLERYAQRRDVRIADILEQGVPGADPELKAIVLAQITDGEDRLALDAAIMAAAATNPDLLAPIQERSRELWIKLDNAQAGSARARMAWKAAMGHRLLMQFGLLHETPEQAEAFQAELLALLEPIADNESQSSVFG